MKQYHRYQMNFDGKALWFSGICMGVSIFLAALYYLFLQDVAQVSMGLLMLDLWVPVFLAILYIFLHRMVRLNAPGVYAILGAAMCFVLICQNFGDGSIVRGILGVLGYGGCAAVLIFAAGGWLPGRLPASLCFAVVLLIRILTGGNRMEGTAALLELSKLFYIGGLVLMPIAMIPGENKELSE